VSLSEHEQVNFPGAVAWVARGGWWQRAGAMGAVFEPLRPLMALMTLNGRRVAIARVH
jgi:hypothetical protein